MQKLVQIQIGSFRFRDKATKSFLPFAPIFKMVAPKVVEAQRERIARVLVDCYNDFESKQNFDCDEKKGVFDSYVEPKNSVP